MPKTCWMINTTLENYTVTRERGFDMIGIDGRNSRKAAQIVPGDRLVFYIPDTKRFVATATVKSKRFHGSSKIWNHSNNRENFRNRVRIEPDYVADEPEEQIDGYQVGPTLEYVKRWVPEHWNLALFGMVHILSQRDFDLLEGELKKGVKLGSRNDADAKSQRYEDESGRLVTPRVSENTVNGA